jgi:hypothetical protein
MVHVHIATILLCFVTTGGPEEKVNAQNALKPRHRTHYLIDRLTDTVMFDGFDDPRFTLQDALDYLTDRYDLSFDVDEKAFAKALGKDKPRSILAEPVATTPIPKMRGLSLERVIEKVLERVEVDSGATFLIHKDQIFITTGAAASKEVLGDSTLPLPRLLHRRMEKRLLRDALEEIAEYTDATVVLDESVGDKAKETVSASFLNVTPETAVRIVADRTGLTVIRIDNVLYVTTSEKAAKLREDIERDKKSQPKQMPPADAPVKKRDDKE